MATVCCPYCSETIDASKTGQRSRGVGVCPACGIAHHADCWAENQGCTTFQCPHSPQTRNYQKMNMAGAHLVGGVLVVNRVPPRWLKPTLTWSSILVVVVVAVVLLSRQPSSRPPFVPTAGSAVVTNPTTAPVVLSITNAPPASATPTPKKRAPATAPPASVYAEVKNDPLNVRAGPGTDYAAVSVLHIGDRVQITGWHGKWWRVRLPDGRAAWLFGGYVKVIGNPNDLPLVDAPPR